MPRTSPVEITQTTTAKKIYQERHRKSAIANYNQQRTDGVIPAKPDDCATERGIRDDCKTSLSATNAQYEKQIADARTEQSGLNIDPHAANRKVTDFQRQITKSFEEKKAENNDLFEELERAKGDIRTKAITEEIEREPQITTTAEVASQAVPFGAIETF